MRGANEKRTGRSRSLRRSSTRAELTLWRQLRDSQLGGFKFVRQEPVGPYYPDFVCREQHLRKIVQNGGASNHPAFPGRRGWFLWPGAALRYAGSARPGQGCARQDSARPSPQPSPRDPRVKPGEGEGVA